MTLQKIINDNFECTIMILTPTICTDDYSICLYENLATIIENDEGIDTCLVSGEAKTLNKAFDRFYKNYYKWEKSK